MDCITVRRLSTRGVEFDSLADEDKFRERVATINAEITKYLKRVRKQCSAKLRFLVVAEAHKEEMEGLPHFHLLVHETSADAPITKRALQGQWKLGFTSFKLAKDQRGASYPCKYLTKSMLARVRGSKHYGSNTI